MNKPKKILVVDDEDLQLTVVRSWLESAGYEVVTHRGALGAAALVFEERPDVVLLDIVMPGLSGEVFARLLAKTWESLEIRLVFYSMREPLPRTLKGLPVLGAIRKTPDRDQFLSRLEEVLESRPSWERSSAPPLSVASLP